MWCSSERSISCILDNESKNHVFLLKRPLERALVSLVWGIHTRTRRSARVNVHQPLSAPISVIRKPQPLAIGKGYAPNQTNAGAPPVMLRLGLLIVVGGTKKDLMICERTRPQSASDLEVLTILLAAMEFLESYYALISFRAHDQVPRERLCIS